MLRGILSHIALVISTGLLSLPVMILVLLVPRWSNLGMVAGKAWAYTMLAVTGTRVRYRGLANIRRDGPAIYVSNHQSNIDIWALVKVLPLSMRFVAKHELFRIPILGPAMKASGFISINRSDRAAAIRSLDLAAQRVRSGYSVFLFAEGTRSRDGKLRPFKKGAFHLALKAGVPVIPVAIRGSFEVWRPGALRVRPGTVHVAFETPIDVAPFQPGDFLGLLELAHAAVEGRLADPAFAGEAADP